MAGLAFKVKSGEVALASGVAKTVLQVKAPANQRVLIKEVRIMGKQAAGGTDSVVKVRVTDSSANFGTAGSTPTPTKNNLGDPETVQTTAGASFSAEPTSPTDCGLEWEVQPQSAIIEPLMIPIVINGGHAKNFELTAPSGTPTLEVQVDCEE